MAKKRLGFPDIKAPDDEPMSNIRTNLNDSLKVAMKAKEQLTVSTLRLILAALKDRDIADRSNGNVEGIDDDAILAMLQSMIKQRRDSISAYEAGGRAELAQREQDEITVIEGFLPEQMGDDDIATAVDAVLASTGASSLKEMGQVMAALREKYAGRMDFSKVGPMVKDRLG